MKSSDLTVLELCAGGGGQSSGLEDAGFVMEGAVEIDERFCATLRHNRPQWKVIQGDLRAFSAKGYKGIDLVAAGVPCPPFSIAGKQLGADDERDLFPEALRIVSEVRPRAVLLENVAGFASAKFTEYRLDLMRELLGMGYIPSARLLNASDYGVPQLRPRFVIVGLQEKYADSFEWPEKLARQKTVGQALRDLMSENGWKYAFKWAKRAAGIAPTLVGGSTKHGGPDLGPTRARAKWAQLGVDGSGIAEYAPTSFASEAHTPRLTVRMAARVQGFPDDWDFVGKKTIAYRQVGNAFPPPVAKAVGVAIKKALTA